MIQRPELPTALAEFLGVKGFFTLDHHDALMPTVSIATMQDTPYLRYGIPVGRLAAEAAGGIGVYSYMLVRPGPNVVLQVKRIVIPNTTGATAEYEIRLLTAAEIATLTVTTTLKLFDLASRDSALMERSSEIIGANRNAAVGITVDRAVVLNNENYIWDAESISPGGVLFGNNPAGRPGLAVINLTTNAVTRATFQGREWPLPG